MQTLIKCINLGGSYLKIDPNFQAVALENNDKIFVSVNGTFELTAIEPVVNNHRKITLMQPVATNQTRLDYYIYVNHWDITTNKPAPVVSKNSAFIQKQIDTLTKYSKTGTIDLNTSCVYFSQRDNYTMPQRTCNSSANAMYLNWLQRASGQPNILTNDDEYLRKVLQCGDTIFHENQTQAIKQYGFSTVWSTDGDYSKLKELVLAGFVVPINILHRGSRANPRGGHIVCVIGYKNGVWSLADSYGTFESGYTNPNGMYSSFQDADLKIRWQGGYRYLA